jgi:DNA-binding MarR family transcriptional regulator
MSWKIMRTLMDMRLPRLTASQKLVLVSLARYGTDTGESIYPSVDRLATNSNLSPSQVQKILRHLEHIGYVQVLHRSTGGNFYSTTLRRLDLAKIMADGRSNRANHAVVAVGNAPDDDAVGDIPTTHGEPSLPH